MQINDLDEFLKKYIEGYLLIDLESVHGSISADEEGNAAYLMLGGLCAGIEFLGYLLGRDYTLSSGRVSTAHGFEDYCKEYLGPLDARYETFGVIGKQLIRNGIAHNFATKGMIGVTRRGTRETSHLVRYADAGIIIINPDCLLEDFKKSYTEYVIPKLTGDQAATTRANRNYEALRDQYAGEIEETLARVVTDLQQWPWLYRNNEVTTQTTEIIEANGDLHAIS